ncbi:hypothetical protein [Ferrovum sp.]|uniref:hypothetical protein n=1 Tax=Ferrovum sp. TaxID=2609467 RepID=UPI00387ECED8
MSRNTVRKYLNQTVDEISSGLKQVERHKKLDDYKPFIINLLQGFPNLSAVKVERPTSPPFE